MTNLVQKQNFEEKPKEASQKMKGQLETFSIK